MSRQPFGDVAHARARLAAATRNHADPDTLAALRRDLDVAKLQQAAEKLVADWPPLTPAQRDRLSSIFAARSDMSSAKRAQ